MHILRRRTTALAIASLVLVAAILSAALLLLRSPVPVKAEAPPHAMRLAYKRWDHSPPTPRPTKRPVAAQRVLAAVGDPWDCIAKYESGGNWASRGGRFEGGLQFLPDTWRAAGGTRYAAHAYDATPAQQKAIAQAWLARTSWAQWPNTSRRCGYR